MAHTPGPWFVGYSPEYDIDAGDDGQTIGHLTGKDEFDGTVFSVRMLENGEEELVYIAENIRKEETANLIAAAPELLEALEASRKAINTLDEDALGMGTREDGHGGINYWPFKVELLHQIDTAIAKARGEAR